MDAGRGGRRSRGCFHQNRLEIFLSGIESGDGVKMEGGVQMDLVDQEQQRGKASRVFTILFVIVMVLVVLGAVTLFQRRAQYQALAKETETLAIPTVAVIHASVESAQEDLVLPGAMQAYVESPIYARDRKSTRLNSSHGYISYAVFCLKKKTKHEPPPRPHPRRPGHRNVGHGRVGA